MERPSMSVVMLTYTALGDRLKLLIRGRARALAKRLRLPRQAANDAKALIAVDAAEFTHKPMPTWSPAGEHPVTATLKLRVEALEAELAKVEASAAGHRADFERERERAERLMTELLRATADTMAAKETAARFEGELAALRSRPWWRRLAGGRRGGVTIASRSLAPRHAGLRARVAFPFHVPDRRLSPESRGQTRATFPSGYIFI